MWMLGVKPVKAMWRAADAKRFDGLCNLDTAESEKGDNRGAVVGDTEQYWWFLFGPRSAHASSIKPEAKQGK